MRLADRTFLPLCVFISVGHTSTRHTETPHIGYRRLRKKQPSDEICRIMRSPRLPQISKLIQLTERARAKMAVFFADRSTPLPQPCNIELGGAWGAAQHLFCQMAVFFADTGLDIWSSCTRGRPIHRADLRKRRVFTKEEVFKTGRRLRARAVALCSIFAAFFTSSPLPDQWPGAFEALARWSGRGLVIMQDSKNRT